MDDKIHLIMDEPFHEFQDRVVVKLPCGHGNIEVTHYGDQYINCSEKGCGGKWLLVNNQYGSKKIYGSD